MPRSRITLLVLVAVGFAVGAGTLTGRRLWPGKTAPVEPPPALSIDPKHLDVGEVWETSQLTVTLPVENRSSSKVTVSEWARSCSCLSVEPTQLSLAPGEMRTVRATLDLTASLFDPHDGDPVREFATTLVAVSGGEPVGPKWVIRARVKSVLGRLPRELDFGPVSDLAPEPPSYAIELKPLVRLESLTAAVEPPLASAAVVPVTADASQVRVTVRPTLPVAPGEQRATLRLLPVAVGGQSLPACRVRLVVCGGTDVQPEPPTLLLGSIPEGDVVTDGVVFRSLTGRPFEVAPAGEMPPGRSVEVRPDAQGKAFLLTVRGGAGPQTLPVAFRVRQPNRPDYRVEVRVVYHGTK